MSCVAADNMKIIIAEGEFDQLREEIDKSPDLASLPITEQGSTPLMVSSAYGHLDIVKYLISERGVNPNTANANGTTALVFACNTGQLDVVLYLWSMGADINCIINSGDSPLTVAASAGYHDIVSFLCSHAADIEWNNGEGKTALHCACEEGHVDVTEVLLESGAKIDALTSADMGEVCCSPLVLACRNGKIDVARLLVRHGANVFVVSESIIPAEARTTIAESLQQAGWLPLLDLRRVCEQNDTVTFDSLLSRYPSLIRYISATALPSTGGAAAIMLASLHGAIDVLMRIASMTEPVTANEGTPIDMQACGSDGRTALSYAAWAGRAETLDFLISRCGLDVNATNDKGESALYFACMNGHKSAVTVLLNAGANKEKLCQHDICQNLYNFRAEEYESINRTKEEIWAELSKR